MQLRHNLFFLVFSCVLSVATVSGCMQVRYIPPDTARAPLKKNEKMKTKPIIVLLYQQPTWLLIGGKDVHTEPSSDNFFVVSGKELKLGNYRFFNYKPDTEPLKLQFYKGNRIVYWKGKGEITNYTVKEKVILPMQLTY